MKDIDILIAYASNEPLVLTASPVQQGLFSKHAYEAKPKEKEPTLSDDKRQGDMFNGGDDGGR